MLSKQWEVLTCWLHSACQRIPVCRQRRILWYSNRGSCWSRTCPGSCPVDEDYKYSVWRGGRVTYMLRTICPPAPHGDHHPQQHHSHENCSRREKHTPDREGVGQDWLRIRANLSTWWIFFSRGKRSQWHAARTPWDLRSTHGSVGNRFGTCILTHGPQKKIFFTFRLFSVHSATFRPFWATSCDTSVITIETHVHVAKVNSSAARAASQRVPSWRGVQWQGKSHFLGILSRCEAGEKTADMTTYWRNAGLK